MKPSFTKDEFINAVKTSTTIAGIIRKLNLTLSAGNYTTVWKYINKWEIDFSHWDPQKIQKDSLIKFRIENKTKIEDILTENSNFTRIHLKRRLIKEGLIEYCCCKCGLSSWQGEEISLQLDHINGINNDNRIENLRLLCPNCHSQTTNFNRKKCITKRKCIDCSNKNKVSKLLDKNTKITWPLDEDLLRMVEQRPFTTVAKELGVSDNAIRKRLKVRFGYYPKRKWGGFKKK